MYEMPSKIAGIPCIIDIQTCNVVQGSYSFHAASDWDYYGYSDIEFNVLDRKGYKAAWLERKMTAKDKSRIECEILEYMKD